MHRFLTDWYHSKAKHMKLGDVVSKINLVKYPDELKRLIAISLAHVANHHEPKKKLLIIAALIYVISTLDACPDLIPVLGFMDDISVLTAVVSSLKD